MSATWPSTLDQYLMPAGFSYTQQSQVIRTAMDAGPDFVRRRFTAAAIKFNGSIQVTPTEHATFWAFFNNTLHGGADPFTWIDPVSGVAATLRFTDEPKVSSVSSGVLYQIAMSLEILP